MQCPTDPFVQCPTDPFVRCPTDPFARCPTDPFVRSPTDPFVRCPTNPFVWCPIDPFVLCPTSCCPFAYDHTPSPATQKANNVHKQRDLYNTCIVSQFSQNKYCLLHLFKVPLGKKRIHIYLQSTHRIKSLFSCIYISVS